MPEVYILGNFRHVTGVGPGHPNVMVPGRRTGNQPPVRHRPCEHTGVRGPPRGRSHHGGVASRFARQARRRPRRGHRHRDVRRHGPEHRVEAVRITWSIEGVREVINQIEISNRGGFIDFARDAWITTKLTVKLTVDSQIKAINYSIDTVDGHVFIMGIAQNQDELNRVQSHAQDVSYVRRVTSHAVLKNDPSRRLKVRVPPDVSQK